MFISICLYVDKLSIWEPIKSTILKGTHVQNTDWLSVPDLVPVSHQRQAWESTVQAAAGLNATIYPFPKWLIAWRNVRKVITHHTSKPFVWLHMDH